MMISEDMWTIRDNSISTMDEAKCLKLNNIIFIKESMYVKQ